MPVFLFVGQVFRVDADDLMAFGALIGEDVLVARDAEGLLVPQHVLLAGQTVVALTTTQLTPAQPSKVLVHCLRMINLSSSLCGGLFRGSFGGHFHTRFSHQFRHS